VIQEVEERNKRLNLCGVWNINVTQESIRFYYMQELLSLHNLINTVGSPSRVTKNTVLLIDVIVTNKDSIGELATLMDLGYSDHKAQIL